MEDNNIFYKYVAPNGAMNCYKHLKKQNIIGSVRSPVFVVNNLSNKTQTP
jgi:hypothetical protein